MMQQPQSTNCGPAMLGTLLLCPMGRLRTWLCARPGTQCLDIAHVAHLVIEKGMEQHSRGAIASSDIRRFYDNVPVLSIAHFLISEGCCHALVCAILLIQLFPTVFLYLLGNVCKLNIRTAGCTTGSRLAGVFGQIIILDCVAQRNRHWIGKGFPTTISCLYVGTWIDNLFSFSMSLRHAIEILEDIELYIHTKWKLEIKTSSRCTLVCRGSPEQPSDPLRWPLQTTMNVLGHCLQNDGGIMSDWNSTKTVFWGCFWKNAGCTAAKHLPPSEKVRLLYRTVVAKVQWKLSRWPFQKTVAVELDKTQCRMTAFLLPCVRERDEALDSYCRRRLRNARNVCEKVGFWSELWCRRVTDWDAHDRRGAKYKHICASLVDYKHSQWLMHERSKWVPFDSENTRCSVLAGRTGTRCNVGRPQTRWEDGLKLATEVMKPHLFP